LDLHPVVLVVCTATVLSREFVMYQSAEELDVMVIMGSLAGVLNCFVHYSLSLRYYAVESRYPSSQ
jgi:hypothetical protein